MRALDQNEKNKFDAWVVQDRGIPAPYECASCKLAIDAPSAVAAWDILNHQDVIALTCPRCRVIHLIALTPDMLR